MDVQTRVGTRWDKEIQTQLQAAKAVVALWSVKSTDSDFVLAEAEYGRRHNILFPAFIESVEFPYGFGRIQTADLIGWKGEANHPDFIKLLAALREHLGVGRQPIAATVDESRHRDADLRPVEKRNPYPSGEGRVRAKKPDNTADTPRRAGISTLTPTPLPQGEGLNSTTLKVEGNAVEIRNPYPSGEGRVRAKKPDKTANSPRIAGNSIIAPTGISFIPGQTFRDTLKDGGEGPLMVVIPPGKFLMGSPPNEPERIESEGPQHEVIIQNPFALGICAVTFADYDLFCRDTKKELPDDERMGRGNHPVINVSWHDAQAYCAWLSKQTGQGYRLPSESEWEYACRAGTQTPFSFGGNITPEQVNYDGNYPYPGGKKGRHREKTLPVQSLPPNAWGLHEMHGNVWEWVQDAWHGNYNGASRDGSAWEIEGYPHSSEVGKAGAGCVVRGGSWLHYARHCRSAFRSRGVPDDRYNYIGFRCARVQS